MRLFKRLTKRGQTGQSLVILAIGFLALLGFVGIVTDVSVLFIRYSTMRRAIDAAAIAAAGQMRRVADDTTPLVSEGEAMSVANLNLAARQFIEVYGLNPKNVIVETCRAQQVGRDANGAAWDKDPSLPGAQPLFNLDGSDNTLADADVLANYKELCTDDELKLVRVTAQIDAPTIFLRLLGYPTVTLTESAISQTAVIDVVMIFDVSESMLNETTYDEWDTLNPPQGVRYIPPKVNYNFDSDPTNILDPWDLIPVSTQTELNLLTNPATTVDARLGDKTMMYEPVTLPPAGGFPATPTLQEFTNTAASPVGRVEPREFCRVRGYPSASAARVEVPVEYRREFSSYLTSVYPVAHPADPYQPTYLTKVLTTNPANSTDPAVRGYYIGFVPMYNFFGCCNDPDGSYGFEDLICQPFKEARDAAEDFLTRLDFLRGDRVGFVTFNREAFLIDPDGDEAMGGGTQTFMIETERDLVDLSNPANNRAGAVETLRSVVGVMAEGNYYGDSNSDGEWDSLVDGYGPVRTLRTYDSFLNDVAIGQIIKHPVANSCPFDKALLNPGYLMPNERLNPDGTDRTTALLLDSLTVPEWYLNNGIPSPPATSVIAPGASVHIRNYEYKASCAGTNIGGALAGGSLMLWEEGRREGAVWIMVMLSDGAAGASNPIYTIQSDSITAVNPYAVDAATNRLEPEDGDGGVISGPRSPGGYGYFGLCPYGTEANPTQLLLNSTFPSCGDLLPESRHYCGTVPVSPSSDTAPFSPLDEDDFAAANRCIDFYDVDDYARDWADWVGIADLPNAVAGGTTGRVSDQLLPTIFSIGFGLNYEQGTGVSCAGYADGSDERYACMRGDAAYPGTNDTPVLQRERSTDYLGEELLRYIADIGDNFQIDSDYWQLCASQTIKPSDPLFIPQTAPCLMTGFQNTENRIGNEIYIYAGSTEWGVRGPCEQEWTLPAAIPDTRGNTYSPEAPVVSCGNYFAAPSGNELEVVFNQIASRMFTRLSQ